MIQRFLYTIAGAISVGAFGLSLGDQAAGESIGYIGAISAGIGVLGVAVGALIKGFFEWRSKAQDADNSLKISDRQAIYKQLDEMKSEIRVLHAERDKLIEERGRLQMLLQTSETQRKELMDDMELLKQRIALLENQIPKETDHGKN